MRKVAVFGGSGTTGLCVVEAALKKGLSVRALARDPTRFPAELREKIEIVQGDVLNPPDVEKTVEGVDGVVIVLGTRNDVRPTTVMSKGTENVLAAMNKAGIKAVSACLSAFLFRSMDQVPAVLRALTEDHIRLYELLKASDRDWIAVCPPHIDGGATQKPNFFNITSHACKIYVGPGLLGTVAYAILGVPAALFFTVVWPVRNLLKRDAADGGGQFEVKIGESPGRAISKYDLGAFLVDCLEKKEYYHQKVGLAKTA